VQGGHNEVGVRVEGLREARMTEARAAVEEMFAWVVGPAGSLPLQRFDAGIHRRLMALGLAFVGLWLAYQVAPDVPQTLRRGVGWYQFDALRAAAVRTRYGVSWWQRPLYRLVHGAGDAAITPADAAIGLAAGRMSLSVHLAAARLAARMPFAEAKGVMESFDEYAPATRSFHGIVDLLGPMATAHMNALPTPNDDGDVVVVEFDGKGIPHMTVQEHERRSKPHRNKKARGARSTDRRERKRQRRALRKGRERKKVGDKSKNARMATVAIVYTLRVLPDGTVEGPLNRRVFAQFSNPKNVAKLALADAKKRGYGTKESLFLADGAPHLWQIWRRYFPLAKPCLDWYHLGEYVWDAASAVHGKDAPRVRAWAKARQGELMRGDVDAVLRKLTSAKKKIKDSDKGCKKRRKKLKKAIRYIGNHREMLCHYADLHKRGLTYGTGGVEGTIKHIAARLDGCGMRWSKERAEHMLALRCVLASGEWKDFEERVRTTHENADLGAVPRITPANRCTPHNAAKKAA